MTNLPRRDFLLAGAAGAAAAALPVRARAAAAPAHPVAIASANGLRAVEHAVARVRAGADCVDGVVEGIRIVELDPEDRSVGLGGLPNEDGVVQLDASVMHGPSHKAGAVAAIEDVATPAAVALRVLRATDHVLLVGAGARRFALEEGFPAQDLLTDASRARWRRWRANLNPDDDRLDDDQQVAPPKGDPEARAPVEFTWGTIHCAAIDANGDVSAATSTSGLSWKIPGRVGDSPIVGAGMFVDNAVGAAGATGRGESCIQSCAAFQVVRHMEEGVEPAEACRRVLRWIADHTKRPDLLADDGRPNFGVVLYALRKDGAFGCASMRGRARFAVCDANGARHETGVAAFE